MSKIAVVYWSRTGNTQQMAQTVADACGGELLTCGEFDAAKADAFDAVALGCPAMGAEELEESEMRPMFDAVKASLSGKKVALFGSYDWGDGEWMRTWYDRCSNAGAEMIQSEGLIANLEPDDDAIAACKELGAKLQ